MTLNYVFVVSIVVVIIQIHRYTSKFYIYACARTVNLKLVYLSFATIEPTHRNFKYIKARWKFSMIFDNNAIVSVPFAKLF